MHGAFDTAGQVDETANQRATAMGAAILDGVDRAVNVEEGDFDAVEFDELAATSGEFVKTTDFSPGFGHEESSQ